MRGFGFDRLAAALAGLAASLLATDGLYGFDLASYVWRGYGMYTQFWGMVLLPPALAQGYTALKTGRGIPSPFCHTSVGERGSSVSERNRRSMLASDKLVGISVFTSQVLDKISILLYNT